VLRYSKYPNLYYFVLQKLQKKAKEYADAKVTLSEEAIELVKKHLTKLESICPKDEDDDKENDDGPTS